MAASEGALSPLNTQPVPALEEASDPVVWIKLCIMMFLQFAVWGSWFTVLGRYLDKGLGFSGTEQGSIYGTMALGAIFSMTLAGQLADRVLASEYLMAIFHIAGAAVLFLLTRVHSFAGFWWVAFLYALLYNPTLTIANSLAFANIKDSVHFAWVRVFGTIGWIAAGLSIDFVLPKDSDVTNRPLMLAAILSAVLGVFSFVLPHTPPSGKKGDRLPFLRAFGLLRDPNFAIFFGLSFAITIALAFYYGFAGVFLGDAGIQKIASVMTIGQWSEIGFMLLLPFGIRYLGMKPVLLIGMAAWVARYGLFSAASHGTPYAFILLGVALHGVCFDFFLAAGFIHTDNKAPVAIRGSAQALFSFLTYGVGMWIGNELSGRIVDHYTVAKVKDWHHIWMAPAIAAAVCLLLFLVLWRDRPGRLDEEVAEARGFPVEPVAVTPATAKTTSNA
jgi:nucleoside transporter